MRKKSEEKKCETMALLFLILAVLGSIILVVYMPSAIKGLLLSNN